MLYFLREFTSLVPFTNKKTSATAALYINLTELCDTFYR